MQLTFTRRDPRNSALLLIYAGWAMDHRPFAGLAPEGCDVAVIYDYRTLDLDPAPLERYADIYVIAWSFGVHAAALTASLLPRPALRIAVNGTVTPVDDLTGITRAMAEATLAALTPQSLAKFYRRMFDSPALRDAFEASTPERPIEELAEELRAIIDRQAPAPATPVTWDRVIISTADRIFPRSNMERAWAGEPRVRLIDEGHHPDFGRIIRQELFDKELVGRKFRSAIPTYDYAATVQTAMARCLWGLWRDHSPEPPLSILEVGYGTGLLTRQYLQAWRPYRVSLWDLAPVPVMLPAAGEIIAGDAERLIRDVPDAYYEAVASSACIQWFNNLPRFLAEACRVLVPGGLLVLSTFGPGNMEQLGEATGVPLRYYTADELRAMLPEGMTVEAVEEAALDEEFDSPEETRDHLRHTGVGGLRDVKLRPGAEWPLTLTYRPILMIIRKNLPR